MLQEKEQLALDSIPVPQETETVHLGIDRNLTATGTIEKKAQLGRRTMYSLIGAGAYGNSGVNPSISCKMWRTFGPPWFNYWFSFTLVYSRISHGYSFFFYYSD